MHMRYGAPTPTANRLLRLFGIVGVMLVLSIVGLAAVFLVQPDEPPSLAGLPETPGTGLAGTIPAGRPTIWTVRLATHPATGQPEGVVDDPRVVEMVKADYLEGETWFQSHIVTLTHMTDPEAQLQQLQEYFTSPRMNELVGDLLYYRQNQFWYQLEFEKRALEVRNFSPDGLEVFLGDSWHKGKVWRHSLTDGSVTLHREISPLVIIFTMRYDRERGRWRCAALRVPEIPPQTTPGGTHKP